jgi:tetratricopeptide (TPR) repeat protein
MRRHAADGDRHAGLRQFERLDKSMRRELGVGPGREAIALRDQLLAQAPRPRVTETTVIGRRDEHAVVRSALVDASAGRASAVLVSGAAGMGKSSLLRFAEESARELGWRVASGVAAPIEGAWPYAPVVQALADLCRSHPTLLDGLADMYRIEIERVLSGALVPWSGENGHQRLFVAAAELVRLAAGTTGLLLCVDDMHDADDASLRLMHYLARASRGAPFLLVMAYRPNVISSILRETLHSLTSRHSAIELQLTPFAPDEIRELVARHVPDLTDDVVDRIGDLSGGVPFSIEELARRWAEEPDWVRLVDVNTIGGLPPATRELLQRVAVIGLTFDTDQFVALAGVPEQASFAHLDRAIEARVIEPGEAGYRFRHGLIRDALLGDLPPHRHRVIHRDAAERLEELGASPAQIGHHLIEAGEPGRAVAHLIRAAETAAAVGAYRDAFTMVSSVVSHAHGRDHARLLAMRADLLSVMGDPAAVSAYREALEACDERDRNLLRARLSRAALMSGDLETAGAALRDVEANGIDGADVDPEIMLAKGNLAYFVGDYDTARAVAEHAQNRVLAGERNWQALDLVTLQGLLAHHRGDWFDRIAIELRRTRDQPEIANSIFDGYLCAAEYLLYGPTPYADVIELARGLRSTADRSGALRAVAFAAALIGEAALLSGDLETASIELGEAAELHRDLGSRAGESHSLQRLAEVRLAQGDRAGAMDLLEQALPLARWSLIAHHLLQRIYGTMIAAETDPLKARAIVDRAESTLGTDDTCTFCAVMLSVPAAIACARSGDLAHARHHLDIAERSVQRWDGTAWEAAVTEARAYVALAEGEATIANELLSLATRDFYRFGQPLDAQRCSEYAASL